jgi:cobalt-zinc-cadmium efflux system protein
MSHHHHPTNYNRAFAVGILLNIGFVCVELFYGILADSLALVADAGHNLTDVLALLMAWGANRLANRKPTHRLTYGLRRTTILAPLFSGFLLFLAMVTIASEAITRLNEPELVEGRIVIYVAAAGVFINAVTARLFLKDQQHDLNIRAVYVHMLADSAVSIGVVIGGVAMIYTGKTWLDPAISLIIVAVILRGTWALLADALRLAVDAVPADIDPFEVRQYLLSLPGVVSIHDLHIWGMSTTEAALTAHLVIPEIETGDQFLQQVAADLNKHFDIGHSTIQVESGMQDRHCLLAPGGKE